MITIREIKKLTKEMEQFQREEWKHADIDHYGKVVDWQKEEKVLEARENGKLVGVMELVIQGGVMHIESILIKHDTYGQGIGKSLMQKAEEIAKEYKLHKIYLETGKTWDATKFYKALGYVQTAELKHHLVNSDYVIFSKFLS